MNRFSEHYHQWVARLRLLCAVAIVAAAPGTTSAALLGNTLNLPLIAYDNQGTTHYNAAADVFSVDATPLAIRFAGGPPAIISGTEGFVINVTVDDTGALTGGVPGDDLVVSGDVTVPGLGFVSGVLLTGEVTGFGFQDSGGSTDSFDFTFTVTGGQLASLYSGAVGVALSSEQSDFSGYFTVDFSGEAKGTLGGLPQALACVVIIDEEGVDNDMRSVELAADGHGVTPDFLVNDDRPTEVGNPWFRWNTLFPGDIVKMPTGQIDDEGWFALPPNVLNGQEIGIQYADDRSFVGTYEEWIDRFVAGSLPQDLLDKVRYVMPFRNQDLVQLVGKTCVAVVYDSDISMNYEPIYANLQGERYGLFAFTVLAVETAGNNDLDEHPYTLPESKSSSTLYDLWLRVEPEIPPGLPFRIKIHDQEPDSIQIDEAVYEGGVLTVRAQSAFAEEYGGNDMTAPTPADPEFGNDPNNKMVYMTLSVDGPDEGSDPNVAPFLLEQKMIWLGGPFFEFLLPTGENLDGRRVNISTDEGGAYTGQINR